MANSSEPVFGYYVLPNQASRGLFQRFFPAWNDGLQVWLQRDCASQLQDYQHGKSAYGAINCFLNQFPEFRKAEMAVSSVILGLIPVVIQQLGATTIEIGAMSLRRPLLAAVLALGSPAVIPKRASDYTPQSLGWNGGCNRQVTTGSKQAMWKHNLWHGTLHYAVYPIALASLGNVAYLSYQLSYQAISAFAVGTTFLPMLWAFLALLIHVVGASDLHLRYEIRPADPTTISRRMVTGWLTREFVYHYSDSRQIRLDVVGGWREVCFQAVTWLLYTATSVHLAFGTMVLASLLFVSIADATTILGRFIASTIVNRLILVYEFTRIQQLGFISSVDVGGRP